MEYLEMIFIRLLHLLAHHPDFGTTKEELLDAAMYVVSSIIFVSNPLVSLVTFSSILILWPRLKTSRYSIIYHSKARMSVTLNHILEAMYDQAKVPHYHVH